MFLLYPVNTLLWSAFDTFLLFGTHFYIFCFFFYFFKWPYCLQSLLLTAIISFILFSFSMIMTLLTISIEEPGMHFLRFEYEARSEAAGKFAKTETKRRNCMKILVCLWLNFRHCFMTMCWLGLTE